MSLKKVLSEETISLQLAGTTKQAIIEELLDLLVNARLVSDRAAALKALLDREAKMSTGMQHGLALPHAKADVVDRLVAAIGIKKAGMDFQSIDGQPSQIFVLTLSPLNRAGPHIQFLAEIGRLISDPAVRQRLLAATTPAAVVNILGG